MKIKELRGLIFSFLLISLDIALFIVALSSQNKMKMIVSLLIVPIILVGFFTQFYIRVLSDSMLIYHFIGIIAMPVILDYKDIEKIELKGKFKINIHAKQRTYPIYVLNAAKFFQSIHQKWEDDQHEKN